MRVRMLQSHICVSPGLPPSPPPLPSPMPKEEIVLVKYGARAVPAPRKPRAGVGGVWGVHWEAAPPRQAGGHRYGSGGSTAASDVPQHAGRLPALLASRSRGCQPLSRILAIFGVFRAKIHSKEKRLHRLRLPGTMGSPQAARKPSPPQNSLRIPSDPMRAVLALPPASLRPGPSITAPALPCPNPTPNYFHRPQLLVSPHSRTAGSPPNSPAPSAQT